LQIINTVNVFKMYFKYFLDFLYVQSIWDETNIFVQSNFVICGYTIFELGHIEILLKLSRTHLDTALQKKG
jgi:hypothetical protein